MKMLERAEAEGHLRSARRGLNLSCGVTPGPGEMPVTEMRNGSLRAARNPAQASGLPSGWARIQQWAAAAGSPLCGGLPTLRQARGEPGLFWCHLGSREKDKGPESGLFLFLWTETCLPPSHLLDKCLLITFLFTCFLAFEGTL